MTTNEILKMTPDEYEMLVMNWWTSYCAQKGRSQRQVQKLMTDNTLYNWWRAELRAVEGQFIEDAAPYAQSYDQNDAKELYARHAHKLQRFYNHNIIKNALKNESAN